VRAPTIKMNIMDRCPFTRLVSLAIFLCYKLFLSNVPVEAFSNPNRLHSVVELDSSRWQRTASKQTRRQPRDLSFAYKVDGDTFKTDLEFPSPGEERFTNATSPVKTLFFAHPRITGDSKEWEHEVNGFSRTAITKVNNCRIPNLNGVSKQEAREVNGAPTQEKTKIDDDLTEKEEHSFSIFDLLSWIPLRRNEASPEEPSSLRNASVTNTTESVAEKDDQPQETLFIRKLWRRRHARSLEEGIRREKSHSALSSLLGRTQLDARAQAGRRYVERTIMGLIHALAEEVEGLDVQVKGNRDTPLWRKQVDEVRIEFNRLSFKPLRMGGNHKTAGKEDDEADPDEPPVVADFSLSVVDCPDEAFDRIDVDNSGALCKDELALAINMVSSLETDKESIKGLATELVELYDGNGDGSVNRQEYQQMVEDMAALQKQRLEKIQEEQSKKENGEGPFGRLRSSVSTSIKSLRDRAAANSTVPEEPAVGTIVLSDLKLDLRRFVFGALPLLKHVSTTQFFALTFWYSELTCFFPSR
jgi:hypothetical protein